MRIDGVTVGVETRDLIRYSSPETVEIANRDRAESRRWKHRSGEEQLN